MVIVRSDVEMIRARLAAGLPCCLKKRPTGEEKPDFMNYSAYGVVRAIASPFTIHLRGDEPEDDFKQTKEYPNVFDAVADGWMVD